LVDDEDHGVHRRAAAVSRSRLQLWTGPRRSAIAPPQLTILKHEVRPESKFATESIPASKRGGEPATRVVSQTIMVASIKAKSNAPQTIVGVSWYFVLRKRTGEELFSIPFVTPVQIPAQQTKTFKGEFDHFPTHPRAVTVDELKNPEQNAAQERIVITCVMFSDGTFSPLNDASKRDCERLQTAPEIRRKIEKL